MKLLKRKFRLVFRKRFFTESPVSHWNMLSWEVITASLSEIKEIMDRIPVVWLVLQGDMRCIQ